MAKGNQQGRRVEKAIDLLSQGYRYTQIRDSIAAHYGITTRQADKDISKAYSVLASEEAEERPRKKAKTEQFLLKLAREAMQGDKPGDRSAAVNAMALYSKINGLEESIKIDANVHTGVLAVPATAQDATAWAADVALHDGKDEAGD